MNTLLRIAQLTSLALFALIYSPSETVAQTSPLTCNLDEKAAFVRDNPRQAFASFNEMRVDDQCFTTKPRETVSEPCNTSSLTDPLCLALVKWNEAWRKRGSSEVQALLDQAFDILARIQSAAAILDNESEDVRKLKLSFEKFSPDSSGNAIEVARENNTGIWDEDPDGNLFGSSGINPQIRLDSENSSCTSNPIDRDRCSTVFRNLVHIYTLATLQKAVVSTLLRDDRAAVETYLMDLDTRWKTYFADSRGILPWELYLNGLMFKPERGFNEPPNGQFILFHPNPSLAVGGNSGNNIDAVLTLELVGYYGWRWEGGNMKAPFKLPSFFDENPIGGSVVLGFDGNNDPGLGGVLHLPRNWSIGAMVDTDGDITGLVSVDLAKLEFFTGDAGSIRDGLLGLFKGL